MTHWCYLSNPYAGICQELRSSLSKQSYGFCPFHMMVLTNNSYISLPVISELGTWTMNSPRCIFRKYSHTLTTAMMRFTKCITRMHTVSFQRYSRAMVVCNTSWYFYCETTNLPIETETRYLWTSVWEVLPYHEVMCVTKIMFDYTRPQTDFV